MNTASSIMPLLAIAILFIEYKTLYDGVLSGTLYIMSSKHYHYYRTGQHTLYTATVHDQQTLMAIYTYLTHWEIVYVTM